MRRFPQLLCLWRVSGEVSCMCLCVRSCLIVRNGQADLNLSSKDRKLWGFCAWGFFFSLVFISMYIWL